LPLQALMVCDHLAFWSQRSVAEAVSSRLHTLVRRRVKWP
jgi:phage gp46-like protein